MTNSCPASTTANSHPAQRPEKPRLALRIDANQNTRGVVYQTARADLLDLESLGLLLKAKRGNAYEFYPVKDLLKQVEVLAEGLL